MMDEFFNLIEPTIKDDYDTIGFKSGMTLEDYRRMRHLEFAANEVRFPGSFEFYIRKIKKVKKWFLIAKLAGIVLFIKSII